MHLELFDAPGGVTGARLVGRLDAAGADAIGLRFTAGLAAAGRSSIVDLSGVSFVASMGIRLLVSTAKALRLKGCRMVLFGAQPDVQETFVQAALDQILDIVSSQDAAVQALAP
jgi:anti-anti-sigma factor